MNYESMSVTLAVDVSYGQIAIYSSALEQPFNDWTDRHVAQGFAWRPQSVSFRTLSESGPHFLELTVTKQLSTVSMDAVRVIEVPFDVPCDGAIEVGSIADTKPLTLPSGSYLLRCEFLQPSGDGIERVSLVFASEEAPHFAIVLADELLSSFPLLSGD